jgi:hypothetical protein
VLITSSSKERDIPSVALLHRLGQRLVYVDQVPTALLYEVSICAIRNDILLTENSKHGHSDSKYLRYADCYVVRSKVIQNPFPSV